MDIKQLDDSALMRISFETRRLMVEKLGPSVERWMDEKDPYVQALARCTWLAIRKELNNG
jgi:hypothetical protein